MALLEVVRVSKSFSAATAAVRDVSIAVKDGEILCLLGPSGCGKTTLLRLIAGLEIPDRGEILFEGRDLAGVKPHERGFGMMFQDFALFPHKNVRENVAFGLRMHGLPAPEIAARVGQMLSLVDMAGFDGREIAGLSGGEQQRVALARALAPGPRLLMLDEPLGALDRALRERLMLDVRAILKRIGMTAIYVTHDQTEAFAVSDRLAVMNTGQIEQISPPQAVYARPASPFVAQFLGFRNLLPGRVREEGVVETGAGLFRPSAPLPAAGAAVTLLIKPIANFEKPATEIAGVNQIEGIVAEITFRGRFSQVWLNVAGRRLLFEEPDDIPFRAGETIQVTVSSDDLLVYETSP
jgi:ABC-type Fe3+/spermidine/putrescine transport system ATPase subunit